MPRRSLLIDDKKKDKLVNEVNIGANSLGFDTWDSSVKPVIRGEKLGLCQSCMNLCITKSKYTIKIIRCDINDGMHLSEDDPVVECSNYSKRGALTLNAMIDIATIISPAKDKAGF